MENIRYDLMAALPELFIVCMAMFILIADQLLKKSNRIYIYGLSQVTLLAAAYITFSTHTPSVTYAFTNTFVDDAMSDVLKLMIYLGTSLIFVYSRQYVHGSRHDDYGVWSKYADFICRIRVVVIKFVCPSGIRP